MLVLIGKYLASSYYSYNVLIKPFRFSWKIILLELATTNNDPSVVVMFFLDAVVKLEGMPHALRAYACTVLHVDTCVCLYMYM